MVSKKVRKGTDLAPWEFILPLFMATVLLLLMAIFSMGCATTKPLVRALPLTQSCLNKPVPPRALLGLVIPIEKVDYTDANGDKKAAAHFVVDAESMTQFLNYMEALENIAKIAAGCVVIR